MYPRLGQDRPSMRESHRPPPGCRAAAEFVCRLVDFAAASLIAREAGARVGHLCEVPAGQWPELWGQELIVAAPGIYAALRDLLRD